MKSVLKKVVITLVVMSLTTSITDTNSRIVKAVTLREDDDFENDEEYDEYEFDESEIDEEDELEIYDSSMDYDDALDILEENDIEIGFEITSQWENYYNVNVTLNNISEDKIENWEIEFAFEDKIESVWNAKVTYNENGKYKIKNDDWNQDIPMDGTVTFGMTVFHTGEREILFPEECELTKECVEVFDEYDVSYKEYSRWDNKVSGEITIENKEDRNIEDWKLELESNLHITQLWDADLLESDDAYCYIDNKNYNADIPANGTVTFGFIAECNGEPEISEYYLYEMSEVPDIEEQIEAELEEGYIREEEDFETEEKYEAYQVLRYSIADKMGMQLKASSAKKKTSFAVPARKPGKIILGENALKYTINNVSAGEKRKPKAIQTYAKLGDEVYVVQHIGNDILVTACKENPENHKELLFDENNTMTLEGFAHGQTLEFFKSSSGKVYILVGTNVRKEFSRSLAIVEFGYTEVNYVDDKDKFKEITKLAYANKKRKYFGLAGRIDAALSSDNKTLCVWFATDKNKNINDPLKIGKIQIACFQFQKIVDYFEKHPEKQSLSFKSMKKAWCNYSCEQNSKKQQIRPGGSNQGIEVSNTYKVKGEARNKIYFSAGNQGEGKPLYIGMMTLDKKGGTYRTQLKIQLKNVVDNREMEGLHMEGKEIWFVLSPAANGTGEKPDKSTQYIYTIPKEYLNESNFKK